MVDVKNQSCYEYWLDCTDEYGEYYVMQHLGKKYYKSIILHSYTCGNVVSQYRIQNVSQI